MDIIEKIWKIRESKNISRKEMGEYLNISKDTYKDIEYKKIRLKLEDFLIICKVLNISPIELLNENKNEHFILLDDNDIEDLNRILDKINVQTNNQNVHIQNNSGTINITNSNNKK